MGHAIQTAAANPPVTLAEAKLWCKIDTTADDAIVADVINAATEIAQDYTERQFCNATFDWTINGFVDPARNGTALYLPRAPVSSITHIKYYDIDGTQQTLAATVYGYDVGDVPCRIYLKEGQDWPSLYDEDNVIEIRYIAGYGADETSVPDGARSAIRLLIDDLYNNRGAWLKSGMLMNPAASRLLAPQVKCGIASALLRHLIR
jgi:uncharacterized phiE125 gp8 family phage protein